MRAAGLIALVILSFSSFAHAAELVNINTASAATLDSLPYISTTLATAIVDYRNANGPFARIEDIMNVTGIKSGIFSHIQSLITVGDTAAPAASGTAASSTPVTASAPPATASSSGPPPEYIPVPVLIIGTDGDRTVSSGADTAFTAVVYDSRGNKRDDAVVAWTFGDGMRKVGASVYHEYYDPGEYLAVVRATTSDGGNAQKEIVVTVKDASIKIAGVTPRGIALTNTDSRTLDISLWKLSMGGQEFKIPEDTQVLAGHTVLFSSRVTELPMADTAFLLYPSGEVAAMFGTSVPVQPQPIAASYEQVQKVEPITSPKEAVPEHEKAVIAPAAANELAAAGAALAQEPAPAARSTNILKSPWTLGFLGTVLLAGGAFILL